MIKTETKNGVTTITLNRPEKRNALTGEMIDGLGAAVEAAEANADCRCLVLTGAGDHFAAGRDLGDADKHTPLADVMAYDEAYASIFQRLRRSAKPSVSVVRGYAVAGGFTLSMGCDFVLADRTAKFGALEMRGGFPAAVNSAVLSHLVGPRQALELLLSDGIFDADHLYRIGLINRLAADAGELAEMADAFTAGLVRLDPIAVSLTKETQRAAGAMPLADALVMGKQLNSLLMTSGKIDEAAEIYAAAKAAKSADS
ncbi:MAG: enoyl-CoA hydratase/isomerase family protein [Magnetovibrio sp.]|nr:enoyl-CoA hydratase/isomerase family protein [Magnetovibrio sp.]